MCLHPLALLLSLDTNKKSCKDVECGKWRCQKCVLNARVIWRLAKGRFQNKERLASAQARLRCPNLLSFQTSSKDTAVQGHRLHMAPLIILFQSGTIRRTVVSGFVCIPLQGASPFVHNKVGVTLRSAQSLKFTIWWGNLHHADPSWPLYTCKSISKYFLV